MSVIEARDLTKRYGSRHAIDHVSFTVRPGELVGFLGPNGAGKTTTIRILLGLLRADQGRARVFGLDCWTESRQIRADIGYLPGDLRLYPWMTLRRAIALSSSLRHRDLWPTARVLADRFQLEPDLNAARMSKGTRQKLGIILALAHRPRLLILDEPTTGLDPLVQLQLAESLREAANAGQTVLFSSHTLSEVQQLCERVIIVRRGEIVADDSLATLRRLAKRQVRLQFAIGTDIEGLNAPTPPPGLTITSQRDGEWCGWLTGAADPFLTWVRQQPLADLEISPPDLEQLFAEYYLPTNSSPSINDVRSDS